MITEDDLEQCRRNLRALKPVSRVGQRGEHAEILFRLRAEIKAKRQAGAGWPEIVAVLNALPGLKTPFKLDSCRATFARVTKAPGQRRVRAERADQQARVIAPPAGEKSDEDTGDGPRTAEPTF